jgi:hypothetical protein
VTTSSKFFDNPTNASTEIQGGVSGEKKASKRRQKRVKKGAKRGEKGGALGRFWRRFLHSVETSNTYLITIYKN